MGTPIPAADDAQLLCQALAGDITAQTRLYTATRPFLLQKVRYLAPDLLPDQREDVVQQAWLDFQAKGPTDFQPSRGHVVEQFFRFLLLNAIKTVRAQYCPPGQRTRPRKNDDGSWEAKLSNMSLDEPAYTDGEDRAPLREQVPDEHTLGDMVETALAIKMDTERILNAAPEMLREAFTLVHLMGYARVKVAGQLRLNRSTLARRMNDYALQVRLRF